MHFFHLEVILTPLILKKNTFKTHGFELLTQALLIISQTSLAGQNTEKSYLVASTEDIRAKMVIDAIVAVMKLQLFTPKRLARLPVNKT